MRFLSFSIFLEGVFLVNCSSKARQRSDFLGNDNLRPRPFSNSTDSYQEDLESEAVKAIKPGFSKNGELERSFEIKEDDCP